MSKQMANASGPKPAKRSRTYPPVGEAGVWLLGLAWFAVVFFLNHYAIDDTFIHLQFARNLAEGRGFRFWPGDPPVYGCTSPGWVALLAAGRLMGLGDVGLARFLSAGFGLAALFALWRLARRLLPGHAAWLAPVILAANPWWVRWSASGMEATFAALIVLAVWCLTDLTDRTDRTDQTSQTRLRLALTGALCGLGALVRPELAMLGPVAALIAARRNGSASLWPRLVFVLFPWLLVGLAWACFAFVHFGTVIPNAASAKAAEAPLLASAVEGLKRLLQAAILTDAPLLAALLFWAFFVSRRTGSPPPATGVQRTCANVQAPLSACGEGVGVRTIPATHTALPPLLMQWGGGRFAPLSIHWRFAWIWPAAVVLFLLAGRAPMVTRYVLIAWPCLTLFGLRALLECAAWLQGFVKEKAGAGTSAAAVALILSAPIAYEAATGFAVVYPHIRTATRNLPVYRQMADTLREKTPKDSLIAVHEIGVLGFYGERRLLDLGGLVSPQVNQRLTRGQKEELTVSLSFLREQGATHYLDPHGKVCALLESGAAMPARFEELASWEFTGGTSLASRSTYTNRLYAIRWMDRRL